MNDLRARAYTSQPLPVASALAPRSTPATHTGVTRTEQTIDRALRALAAGRTARAKTLLKSAGQAQGPLLSALAELNALMTLDGAPRTRFAAIERHTARSGGPTARALATAIRLSAHLAFADWLASTGKVRAASELLSEARRVANGVAIEGFDVVEARVRAASRQHGGPRPRRLRPRARQVLSRARSFARGSLTSADLGNVARLVGRPPLRELAAHPEDFDGDVLLWEGDLRVDGDFRLQDADVTWLVVEGDLVVNGLYDAPNELAFVTIAGALRARDVITAGALDVFGDLEAHGVVLGDFPDGGAHVRGDLTATLFLPADCPFRVHGRVRAVFGAQTPWAELPLVEPLTLDDVAPRLRRGLPILRG